MRKKIFAIVILIFIFNSTLAGIENGKIEKKKEIKEISFSIKFSKPEIIEGKEYAHVILNETEDYIMEPYYPMLPAYKKTITFPIGTKIESIEFNVYGIEEIKVEKKISPCIAAIPSNKQNIEVKIKEGKIYSSINPYPEKWFIKKIGVGLYNDSRLIFLTMEIYPVRYYPALNYIEYAKNVDVKIKYRQEKVTFKNEYDLLIIAPLKFHDSLERLVEHKEKYGIKTMLASIEEILNYNGRDDAEKVKYFIKDCIENYGIKYVLLVGGMRGQRFKWYVPVRYSHLDDASKWEASYLCDLYFADIYKYENGIVFDNWDSNGNGIFAEWNAANKDILDLYPDVYVGRLPCRNEREVKIVVDKTIKYEENMYNKPWFKRMVVIGGDSFPDKEVGTDYIEGQVECDYALSFMKDFEHIRVYVEGGDVEFTPENAEEVLSNGEGFVYFSGHGNPASWATHPHNDFDTWIDFGLKNILRLRNSEKLPVLVVGGCHNCQFNVSVFRLLTEGIWAYYLGEATPECWGWLFVRHPAGGSIAVIGNTGLGYGTIGDGPVDEVPDSVPDGIPDCIQYLGGWLEPHFFEVYSKGKDILGEVWGNSLADYLNKFPIDWSKEWTDEKPYTIEQIDCKTVQEWVLLGDPSLKIGGYP